MGWWKGRRGWRNGKDGEVRPPNGMEDGEEREVDGREEMVAGIYIN